MKASSLLPCKQALLGEHYVIAWLKVSLSPFCMPFWNADNYSNLWHAGTCSPSPLSFPTHVPLRAPGELARRLEKQMRITEMFFLGKMIWSSNINSLNCFLKEIYGHQCREFVVDIFGLNNQLLRIAKTWHHILLWTSEKCEQRKIIFLDCYCRKSQSGVGRLNCKQPGICLWFCGMPACYNTINIPEMI